MGLLVGTRAVGFAEGKRDGAALGAKVGNMEGLPDGAKVGAVEVH